MVSEHPQVLFFIHPFYSLEPVVERLGAAEHVRQQKVEQGPQLVQVVLPKKSKKNVHAHTQHTHTTNPERGIAQTKEEQVGRGGGGGCDRFRL